MPSSEKENLIPFVPPLFPDNNLSGVRVLVRIDTNVPILEDGSIRDTYRLDQSFKTIRALLKQGAKVGLLGHSESTPTTMAAVDTENKPPCLAPIFDYIIKKVCDNCYEPRFATTIEEFRSTLAGAAAPTLVMLENVRVWPGEKKNDTHFARELASCGDMYVNEAFSVSHREHASVVGLAALLPSYAGFLMRDEVEQLSKLFHPERPFVFILGGAKFSTKMPLVERFLDKADTLFVGGALANDFFVMDGRDVGRSLVSKEPLDIDRMGLIARSPAFATPIDMIVATPEGNHKTVPPAEILSEDIICDAGPQTIAFLTEKIATAHTVVWNGPLGNYEKGFSAASLALANAIAEEGNKRKAAQKPFFSVLGGGDTLAVAADQIAKGAFSFVSTGGGAMLDYLTSGTLPGIEALKRSL